MNNEGIDKIINSIRDYIEFSMNEENFFLSEYIEFLISITEQLEKLKK